MSTLRRRWPYLVVVAAPLALFAPFLLGLRVLYWGTIEFQFYPWQQLAVAALRSGHLPLWDPLLGNGAPLLANYQTAALYPPNWLALILPLDLAQPWLAALHLAWAGAGMVALARRLRFPPLSQAVTGLAFGLSQYLVSRVSFLSINAAVAWLPWVVCLVEVQLQLGDWAAPSRRRAAMALLLSLALAAQLLAGHAQTAWYTLLLAAGWCAARLVRAHSQGGRALWRSAGWCAAPLAVAGLLAAVQLLPTAELLQQSPRATAAAYDFVMTYSFSPWRLLTLAAPDLLGNPARGQFFGYGNYWEDAVYVGLLPLLLALGVAVNRLTGLRRKPGGAAHRGPRALVSFLLGLILVSLVWGLGRNTPIFPFLYQHLPTFNLFQAPTRVLIWLVFALSLLAGLGLAAWQRPRGRALYWTRLGAAGAAAMAAVGLLAWSLVSPATQGGLQIQAMGRALALSGALAFITALLSLAHPAGPGESPRWSSAVLVLLLADLWLADAGLNPGAPPSLYQQLNASAPAVGAALGSHRLLYFPDDEYDVKYGRFVSFKSFGSPDLAAGARASLLADTSALDGLASANNFDPLVSARYAGFMDVISATRSSSLLQLMDVGAIASPRSLTLEPIFASVAGGVTFYRAPLAPARLWLPGQAITVATAADALATLAQPGFDPSQTLLLEGDDQPAAPATFSISSAAVRYPVSLSHAGWVLVSDTYYPGWVASLDGQPVPIYHGDFAFRAVPVPAGDHLLVFDYHPASLRAGEILSGAGGLLVLLLAAWSTDWGRLWRRRPND